MSYTRTRELVHALALGFLRDRTAMFFTIVFPLMFLVIFGGLLDTSTSKTEVYVAGKGVVVEHLPGDVLDIERVPSVAEGVRKVRDGKRVALIAQEGNVVRLVYAASDPVAGGTVQGVVNAVVDRANLAAAGAQETFRLDSRQVEDESLSSIEFFTPGILGWAVSIAGVFSAALTLVTWREKGVLRRLRLAPVTFGEIGLARVLVSLGIAFAQTGLFLVVGIAAFGLHLTASWWMVFPLVAAGTLAFLALGLLAGAFAKTVESASALANLLTVPMAFLSGTFFPLGGAPTWLRAIADAMPLRHLLDGMKDVMVRGLGPASALPAIGILCAFAAGYALLASRLFRWDTA